MANQTQISSAVRESITGDGVGRLVAADVISESRDILTGERYGLEFVGDTAVAYRDVLTGERYGQSIFADVLPGTTRDILTGDGYGYTWLAGGAVVVREVLLMEPPFRATAVSREVLVSLPNDPLTVARVITGYRQSVVMLRPTMQLPSTVKSLEFVPTLRQQIVQRAVRQWARSGIFAATLRMQHVVLRNVLPAYDMNSFATVGTYVQQVVRSRGKTYVAVSAVYTAAQRQLVVSTRVVTRAPDVRTAITVGDQRQQILLSRKTVVVVIMTEAHAASFVQQAVVEDTRPAPRSKIDAGKLLHMTVQKHTVVPPGIDDRVGQVREQVMIERVPTVPFGVEHAAAISQQIVAHRATVMHESHAIVGGTAELTLMRRDTYAPAFAVGRHTATLHQQSVVKRVVGAVHGHDQVASMRLSFVLERVVPAPWDVIDPSIGRHAASLCMMTVQKVVTIPPATISKESRYVFNVAAQVALGDLFPAPDMQPEPDKETAMYQLAEQVVQPDRNWGPVSAVTVAELASSLVVSDNSGWIDVTLPTSDVSVFKVAQVFAVADVFLDPAMVRSDDEVAMLGQAVVISDPTMPDPMLPLSEIQAFGMAAVTVIGDAELPDPSIPLSEVRLRRLAASMAVSDPSLVGQFGMSEVRVPSIVEFLVIRDPTLAGIPLRSGPRPIVSVSMS